MGENPDPKSCAACGDAEGGVPATPVEERGRFGRAMFAGALTAVVVGAAWVGLAFLANDVLGFFALLFGMAVGYMVRAASRANRMNKAGGALAAALALVGTLGVKIALAAWGVSIMVDTAARNFQRYPILVEALKQQHPQAMETFKAQWTVFDRPAWEKARYEEMRRNGEISPEAFDWLATFCDTRTDAAGRHRDRIARGDKDAFDAMVAELRESMRDKPEPTEAKAEVQTAFNNINARAETFLASNAFAAEALSSSIRTVPFFPRFKVLLKAGSVIPFEDAVYAIGGVSLAFLLGSGLPLRTDSKPHLASR